MDQHYTRSAHKHRKKCGWNYEILLPETIIKYMAGDTFELEIINFADAYGKIPLVKIWLKGHIFWQGEHPIAPGADRSNSAISKFSV